MPLAYITKFPEPTKKKEAKKASKKNKQRSFVTSFDWEFTKEERRRQRKKGFKIENEEEETKMWSKRKLKVVFSV
jgi:hypothetical protein